MKSDIQIFNNAQFGELRTVYQDNKAWFCLSDVCKALELSNPTVVKNRLHEGGLSSTYTPTHNQYGTVVNTKMIYVDEPNLYRCIFQSRKAEAQKFQDWVFEEVLPSLRKYGIYAIDAENMTKKEIMARAVKYADEILNDKDKKIEEQ